MMRKGRCYTYGHTRSSYPASQECDATSSLQPVSTVEANQPPVASSDNP